MSGDDKTAYVGVDNGIVLVDVTSRIPQILSNIPSKFIVAFLVLSADDNTIFFAEYRGNFKIYDVSNTSLPSKRGSIVYEDQYRSIITSHD